jgi:hypothetical protein
MLFLGFSPTLQSNDRLTYVYSKFEIEVLIEFWERIMEEDNQYMIFFFSVALL